MNDLSTEEMAQVAIYSNRHDAEVAKGMLEQVGIASFVAADDVHPPLQITEGVKLLVLRRDALEARDALAQASMLVQSTPEGASILQGRYVGEQGAASRDSIDTETHRTTWLQKALLGVVLLAVVVGIVFVVAGVILS